jgi:uncharacterized membrane protein
MACLSPGIHRLKARITIQAPVEVCYQAWLDSPHLPEVMRRVVGVQYKSKIMTSAEEIHAKVLRLQQDIVPSATIKHWLISGPGGKLYEFENTVILEIPNHFYCTTSTDPNDFSVQSSVLFSSDAKHKNTFLEWEVSFFVFNVQDGNLTRLASDVLKMDDSLLMDCLQDFKTYLENR